jgi:osmoprotectant transport system permease protein
MNVKTKMLLLAIAGVIAVALVIFQYTTGINKGLKAAFDAEFVSRPDGYPGLKKVYNFEFAKEPMQMDPGLMYKAAADGAVDVIDAFATDGRIKAYNLISLEDNKHFFPPYYAACLIREDTLKKHPQLESVFNSLAGKLSNKTMQNLNYQVDEKGIKAKRVAREYLLENNFISSKTMPASEDADTVVIGGKHFTEQEILGEMLALLLEYKTDLNVKRKLNLGGTMICFQALKAGDIDVYVEYTGTGLVNILKEEVVHNPEKAYRIVKNAFSNQYNLVWLKPLGFNNTYTLTMKKEFAKQLDIKSISDLAEYINREKNNDPEMFD